MQRVESFGVGCPTCGLDSWAVNEGAPIQPDGRTYGVTCSGCGTPADVQVAPDGSPENAV